MKIIKKTLTVALCLAFALGFMMMSGLCVQKAFAEDGNYGYKIKVYSGKEGYFGDEDIPANHVREVGTAYGDQVKIVSNDGVYVNGEKKADITCSGAPQEGVHQRVQEHVAVGMRLNFGTAGNGHASQFHRAAGAVAVHVVAEAGAGQGSGGDVMKHAQVFRMSNLYIGGFARHHSDRNAATLQKGGVVGDVPLFIARPFMRPP